MPSCPRPGWSTSSRRSSTNAAPPRTCGRRGELPLNGRFAPSPTGDLHLGNLRTALLAWLFARRDGSRFALRMEDLDAAVSRPEHEATQLRDLTMLGIDWDGPVLRQSDRRSVHEDAIGRLQAAGRTYRCYCTRREIHAAASAPHGPGPEGAYPGTCLSLTMKERAEREADGRRPALRLAAGAAVVRVTDTQCGVIETVVDDFVLQRSDGVPAYNLAVVVDDAAQGVEQVVRGDDLLSSAPRQAFLGTLLGLAPVAYAHVPLVLGPDGRRLAKRDGAVTLAERLDQGETVEDVVLALLASCGIDTQEVRSPLVALAVFRPSELTRAPWVVDPGRPLRGQHRPLG